MSSRRSRTRPAARTRQTFWLSDGFYEPSVDRAAIYQLSRRSRFWPGSDELSGDEWLYWYGDIGIPSELTKQRRRPDCLYNELQVERQILRQMGAPDRDQRASVSRDPRSSHISGAATLTSALDSAEQALQHADNVRKMRSGSSIRKSSGSHDNHWQHSAINLGRYGSVPPEGVSRTPVATGNSLWERDNANSNLTRGGWRHRSVSRFDEVRQTYDEMLSRMGVTKELTVLSGRSRR